MTTDQLNAIRERHNATDDAWGVFLAWHREEYPHLPLYDTHACNHYVKSAVEKANELFSADIPALLAHIEELEKDKRRLDAYAIMVEQGAFNEPGFDDGMWFIPYLDNGAGGLGGGVSFELFPSLRAAIDSAMQQSRTSEGGVK